MPPKKVASLVSAFLADGKLHVARYIKTDSNKDDPEKAFTGALGYCEITTSAAEGLYQVPNWAFDGRPVHGDVNVCPMCSMMMNALAESQ